ncbi:MAG TPA: FlgD immunoglobulin-like domain containing protein [Anaerolineae bacterium]
MSVRLQQTDTQKQQVRRRATSRGLSFGPLATAITVGTVAILIGVTFIGDWLRIPKLTAEASPTIISPNGDQSQDSTNFSYTLNEDANVTVEVFDETGRPVQTVIDNEFQTRGQQVVVWNGLDSLGQVVEDGRYRLQVTARGTVRAATESVNVMVDTLPPTLRLANLDEVNRVRAANMTVEGITDPDAVVQVQGDPTIIPINGEGHFSIKRQLAEGSNIIQVLATDPAGNVETVAHEVILVTRPPEITIAGPPNDQWTNEDLITVAGVVPAGTSLKINGQEATVAEDGQFEREVILQEGDNVLNLAATDDVGNVTTQEIVVHRKTIPPPLELNIQDGETFQRSEVQLIGKTEAGATILVGGQAVTVSPVGEFQTTVSLIDGENLLEVVAQDQANNVIRRQYRMSYELPTPESELARVARNLPSLSGYFVPVLISLPVLLIVAYILTRPVALVVSSESNSFRPGLPEEGRFLKLAIDLSKPARTSVYIKDTRGNIIATLLHRRHRGTGQQSLYWDGYDDFGRVALPGEYVVTATASTTGGTVTGTLNISVLEDRAVHRQYLRRAPHQDDSQTVDQRDEVLKTATARRPRRR